MYSRILVPLDGSRRAEHALPHAARLGAEYGSELILLRVIPLVPSVRPADLSPVDFPALEEREREAAMAYLTPLCDQLAARGLNVRPALERRGDAGHAIIEFVVREQCSLVIMCSHGRTGLARWMYGGVAEKVLHNVSCQLMLVRIEKKELKDKATSTS